MDSDTPVRVELQADELRLLSWGSFQWGGPGYCTDAMARAMGFEDADQMLDDLEGIRTRLDAAPCLTPRDWSRALISVEVVFASDVVGAAFDWHAVTGWTDEYTIGVLRRLQQSLRKVRARVQGSRPLHTDNPDAQWCAVVSVRAHQFLNSESLDDTAALIPSDINRAISRRGFGGSHDLAGSVPALWSEFADALNGYNARGLDAAAVDQLMRRAATEWLALDGSPESLTAYVLRWADWPNETV